MHMSLLGEFGAGKTWFCRHLAYDQLKRYLAHPVNERLPLLITLRDFSKAMTAEQLINDALIEQYNLPFVGSAFEVFQELNRQGKIFLILDGFDEMARQVDYQTVVDNFWELARLVDESSKVMITCRTEYFRWANESAKVMGGEEFGRHTIILTPPRFEVIHISPFTDDQIRAVIKKRLRAQNGAEIAEKILDTPNLCEMAKKPVLIDLLFASLEEVNVNILESPVEVYLFATNRLLLRNISNKRTFTSTKDKLYFLCELGWEMINSGELSIHYKSIPDRISLYFKDKISDQHELDAWDFDLRSQTLLHRDASGNFTFAHKSLAEFFVALKFAAELGCLRKTFTETYCEADGQFCEIPYNPLLKPEELVNSFGVLSLDSFPMQATKSLLIKMLDDSAVERLWELIKSCRNKYFDTIRYVAGNTVSLLNWVGTSFDGKDLSNICLAGSDLSHVNLMATKFEDAELLETKLINATFDLDQLKYANIRNIYISIFYLCSGRAFNNNMLAEIIDLQKTYLGIYFNASIDPAVVISKGIFSCYKDIFTFLKSYKNKEYSVIVGTNLESISMGYSSLSADEKKNLFG